MVPTSAFSVQLVSDETDVTQQLQRHSNSRLIGLFSSGSNITGVGLNLQALASVLRSYGASAVFDVTATSAFTPIQCGSLCLEPGNIVLFSPSVFPGGRDASDVIVSRNGAPTLLELGPCQVCQYGDVRRAARSANA